MRIIWAILLCVSFALSAEYCEVCGMNLEHHKNTNHTITIDGDVVQTCSLHCVYDIITSNPDKKYSIKGFDNKSKEFKSLQDLFYVIGSKKKSAMTSESEFAFSDEASALKFKQENGGRIIKGKDMLEYEAQKFDKDKKMVEKNQAKMAVMGEKIANEYCNTKALKAIKASNIADFKVQAKGYCKNIDQRGLQAVGLYFWKNKS